MSNCRDCDQLTSGRCPRHSVCTLYYGDHEIKWGSESAEKIAINGVEMDVRTPKEIYAELDPIIDAAWELRQLQYEMSTVNDGHEIAIIMGKLAVARDKLGAALEASPHAMERQPK